MTWAPPVRLDAREVASLLDETELMAEVRLAYVAHAEGRVVSPMPGQLLFERPPGDCHIKYGAMRDGDVFVVKIATGFYGNPALGLPSNNGLVLIFDARTGGTLAVIEDEGWLTSWRTAAGGALAAAAASPSKVSGLGIVGTGHQAYLQARWASQALGTGTVVVWGRSPDRTERLAERLTHEGCAAAAATRIEDLCGRCNVIVTCTASTAPVLRADIVADGTHIVAVGADSPGKQELDPGLLARAALIMTDDHAQCLHHGEFGHAVRASLLAEEADISLGRVLAGLGGRRSDHDITIADLTGLPAQDIAAANHIWRRFSLLRKAGEVFR